MFFFFDKDITTVKIYFDQEDGIYYVGEDAILKADLENPSAVHFFVWFKVRDRQQNAIDMITTTKHTGTVHIQHIVNKKLILKIRGCDSSDAGTYILKVVCKDVEIDSNEIHLKIKQGRVYFLGFLLGCTLYKASILKVF